MKLVLVCVYSTCCPVFEMDLALCFVLRPVQDLKWHCYTDASWTPEGDYSHHAVVMYLGSNLVAWQSQQQSLARCGSFVC